MLALPVGATTLFVDDFDDDATNTSVWDPLISAYGPQVQEANQRLEISMSSDSHLANGGDSFSAGYLSNRRLRGDFDIQVDYQLLTWPSLNGVRTGLNLVTAEGAWLSVQRTTLGGGEVPGSPHDIYVADFGGLGSGAATTSDTSGMLRMNRTSSTLTAYYFGSGGWTQLWSNTVSTGDMRFCLSAWSHDYAFAHQPVTMAFDNLTVNSGYIDPPVPEPAGLCEILCLFGGISLAWIKKRL